MQSFRIIPSIEQLLQLVAVDSLCRDYGRAPTLQALKDAAERLRRLLAERASATPDTPGACSPDRRPHDVATASTWLTDAAAQDLTALFSPSLRPVINATGVIVHTNLGRTQLSSSAVRRLTEVAAGYVNLEYDIEHGRRGTRDVHTERLITRLTGAEAATVVNNNAAATLLLLAALADGREVIVSRGELVEIGGGFRVPDIMMRSGALLREVGTTNKTRPADYAAAVSERTGLILRVHPSNFRIEGFTERPSLEDLVRLGHRLDVPVVEDLGSGHLAGLGATGAAHLGTWEPTVQASIAAGCDVVCFSGDKLLGGPQAGIIVGRKTLVDRMRAHPLMRAIRVDKLTYAALAATLAEHLRGHATRTVPTLRCLAETAEAIDRRARHVVAVLDDAAGLTTTLVDGFSTVGGGSAPESRIPTRLLALELDTHTPDALERRLRRLATPVIARIDQGRVVLDLRTVLPEQDDTLADALRSLTKSAAATPIR